MSFKFKTTDIPGLIYIEPDIINDPRGFFTELYKFPDFKEMGIKERFSQINHSKSSKDVLRGLHYQRDPKAQAKLITVISGEIFDVAVDIRQGSPRYGQWLGIKLDSNKKNMLYIPQGFAHGFCVLSESAEIIYAASDVYSPQHERGIRWNDPKLAVRWPVKQPILSSRDALLPTLDKADNNFTYEKSR